MALNLSALKKAKDEIPDFDDGIAVEKEADETIPMANDDEIPMADDEIPMAEGEEIPSAPETPAVGGSAAETEEDDFARQEREAIEAGLVPSVTELYDQRVKVIEARATKANNGTVPPKGGKVSDNGGSKEDEDEELDEFQKLLHTLMDKHGMTPEQAAQAAREELARRKAGQQPEKTPDQVSEKAAALARGNARPAMGGGAAPGIGAGLAAGLGAIAKAPFSATKSLSDTVRERIFNRRVRQLEEGFAGLKIAGEELDLHVAEVNSALTGSKAAGRLKDIAKKEGTTLEALVSDLNEGRNNSPEALAALKEAEEDPAVASAWKKVKLTTAKIRDASATAALALGSLDRSFKDRFDTEKAAEKLSSVRDKLVSAGSKCMAADEQEDGKRKSLMKQIEEITEVIRKIVERILSKLASAFKR